MAYKRQIRRYRKDALKQSSFSFPAHVKAFMVEDRDGIKLLMSVSDSFISKLFFFDPLGYEAYMKPLFKRVIKPGDRVVTCGAHVGTHAILMSRLVGDKGHVFMFEPNPESRFFLGENCRINGVKNATIYPFAVSSESSPLAFWTGGDTACVHGRVVDDKGQTKKKTFQAVALDDVSAIGHVDVLQMDVEGFEPKVIEGAQKLMARNPNLIVIQEWTPRWFDDPKGYLKFWREKGYQIGHIVRGSAGTEVRPLSDKELMAIHQCNLIMAKELPKL